MTRDNLSAAEPGRSWVLSDTLAEEAGMPSDGERQEGKAEEPSNIWGCPRSTRPSPDAAKRQGTTQTLRAQRRGPCSSRAPMIPARRPTEGVSPSQHLWPPSNSRPMDGTPRAYLSRTPQPPSNSGFNYSLDSPHTKDLPNTW